MLFERSKVVENAEFKKTLYVALWGKFRVGNHNDTMHKPKYKING